MSVIVRYVDSAGEIQECYIGFFDVSEGRDAQSVFEVLNHNMQGYNFKEKLVAQTYDGAAVMASPLNGLQAKVRAVTPSAMLMHCYAHRLNLVLSDCAKCITPSKVSSATLSGFASFFSKTTKKMSFFESAECSKLPRNAPTRWNFTSHIVSTAVDNYDAIVADKSMEDETVDCAKGYIMTMKVLGFVFLLQTYH